MSQTTLVGLIRDHGTIQVPMLQRDFAQGRPTATDIRERFVRALRDALVRPPGAPPLDLDFVYGQVRAGCFEPLDGQQRLTTLFLLHWVVAQREGRQADFRRVFADGERARFTYTVRPSSRRFFNALVVADVPLPEESLAAWLRDAPWFFSSWDLDPTVRSCLAVLDTLNTELAAVPECYDRLVGDAPAITFQFLPLVALGLTDDLYIKMNARGKPLTELETFKAHLEQHVRADLPEERVGDAALVDYLGHRFDTAWSDLFWDGSPAFDARMMSGIRGVAVVACDDDGQLKALYEGAPKSFYDYRALGTVTAGFVRSLVRLFDAWVALDRSVDADLVPGRWTAGQVSNRVLAGKTAGADRMTYELWVIFVAWSAFLLSDKPEDELAPWMRLIANLAEHSLYNRATDLGSSLRSVRQLIQVDDLQAHLRDPDCAVAGFNRQQVREERLKAELRHRSSAWNDLLEPLERHPYFRGQGEFLFDFCGVLDRVQALGGVDWDDAEDADLRSAFGLWFERAVAVFPADRAGLMDDPEQLWRRALLCEGDYLLYARRNKGLLDDQTREQSWKRLLRDAGPKREIVRRVLARVDPLDPAAGLRARIQEGVTEREDGFWGWRALLVEQPELLGLMNSGQLRFVPSDTVYLLKFERPNGRHWDLFTAWLAVAVWDVLKTRAVEPFDTAEYAPVNNRADRPMLVITCSALKRPRIQVVFQDGAFTATLYSGQTVKHETTFGVANARKGLKRCVKAYRSS